MLCLSGIIIRFIGRWQARDFRKGATILKLAANVMNVTGMVGMGKTGSVDEVTQGCQVVRLLASSDYPTPKSRNLCRDTSQSPISSSYMCSHSIIVIPSSKRYFQSVLLLYFHFSVILIFAPQFPSFLISFLHYSLTFTKYSPGMGGYWAWLRPEPSKR